MAICRDCANRVLCTYPRTESTRFCDESEDTPLQQLDGQQTEWDLKTMLEDWGLTKGEAA